MSENFDPEKVELKDDEEQPKTEHKNEEDSDDDIEIIDEKLRIVKNLCFTFCSIYDYKTVKRFLQLCHIKNQTLQP